MTDAFISYSDASDADLAAALERELQRVAKPVFRRRSLDVFRDSSDAGADPQLWASTMQSLDESSYLIVLVSTESLRSERVQREVEYWIAAGRSERLLLALSSGELRWTGEAGGFAGTDESPVIAAINEAFDEEPFWVDLRAARAAGRPGRDNAAFMDGVHTLAAMLRGISKADLVWEELGEGRRSLRLAAAGIGALAVLAVALIAAGGFAWVQWRESVRANEDLGIVNEDLGLVNDELEDRTAELEVSLQFAERKNCFLSDSMSPDRIPFGTANIVVGPQPLGTDPSARFQLFALDEENYIWTALQPVEADCFTPLYLSMGEFQGPRWNGAPLASDIALRELAGELGGGQLILWAIDLRGQLWVTWQLASGNAWRAWSLWEDAGSALTGLSQISVEQAFPGRISLVAVRNDNVLCKTTFEGPPPGQDQVSGVMTYANDGMVSTAIVVSGARANWSDWACDEGETFDPPVLRVTASLPPSVELEASYSMGAEICNGGGAAEITPQAHAGREDLGFPGRWSGAIEENGNLGGGACLSVSAMVVVDADAHVEDGAVRFALSVVAENEWGRDTSLETVAIPVAPSLKNEP